MNIIEVKNVTKKFDDKIIVDSLTLNVKQGETIGIVGRNGSGKTVLLKMICGLYIPTSGNITINSNKSNAEKLGVLIDSNFLSAETGFYNLKLLSQLGVKIKEDKIYELLKLVGLDPYNKTKYKNYSMGMKQKLKLANALMYDSEILILDEPFNGLDKDSVNHFRNIILQYKKQKKTILLTSHNYEDIKLLCDKIYEMDKGILKEVDDYEEK